MSFSRLVTALVFLGLMTMVLSAPVVDTDTWWHLRSGEWMVEQRQILRADPFSFTRLDAPWTNPNWLAQLAMIGALRAFGLAGLSCFIALFVVIGLAAVWRVMEGPALLRAGAVVLLAAAASIYWSARPQIVSFALAGIFVAGLERARGGAPRAAWWLPVGMALWVNVHGGFAIGFLLLAAYLAGEVLSIVFDVLLGRRAWREAWSAHRPFVGQIGVVSLGCLLASGLNPFGYRLLAYPFQTVSMDVLRSSIQEWQAPDFNESRGQAYLVLVVVTGLAFLWSRRVKSVTEVVVVAGFFLAGFLAWRNVPLACLAAAPSLARHGASALARLTEGRPPSKQLPEALARRVNLALLAVLLILAAIQVGRSLSPSALREAAANGIPVRAVQALLGERPPRELFNSYNWGGYILWAASPDYPTFVDGRTDLFDDALLKDYLRAWSAQPGWQTVLDRWGIRSAMIERECPLAAALTAAGWSVVYQDEQAILLTR